MVRALGAIVMQILIISLIKASEGAREEKGWSWHWQNSMSLPLLDKDSHVHPRLEIWDSEGFGWFVKSLLG